ncbi:Coiled-coil domain-containing protein 12 [Sorochytrium milnesiophthora]
MSPPALSTAAQSLEAAALERQQRLQRLRQRKQQVEQQAAGETAGAQAEQQQVVSLRRRREDEDGEHATEMQVDEQRTETVEEQAQRVLSSAKEEMGGRGQRGEVLQKDLKHLAPQKLNWDLERDVAKRLRKLERATRAAIAELIRQRLQENEKAGAAAASASGDDEEQRYKDLAGAVAAYDVPAGHSPSRQNRTHNEDDDDE